MNIDYSILGKAANYYSMIGYEQIEVPWIVTEAAKNITCPIFKEPSPRGLYNIDSGEQSILQIELDKGIAVGNKFFCITPCYRPYDKNRSNIHQEQFVKLELYHKVMKNYKAPVDSMVKEALILFETLGISKDFLITYMQTPEKRHGCEEMHNMDIICNFSGIELGSYGMRRSKDIGTWVYGTGLALPRYQIAKQLVDKVK